MSSYRIEILGGALWGGVVLLLVAPWFAVLAFVAVTSAVLVVLMTLAAAALSSPYLLLRALRRHRAHPTRRMDSTAGVLSRGPEPLGRLIAGVPPSHP